MKHILLVTLLACPTALFAQSSAEVALAKQTLNLLQAKSFKADREYCGYLIFDANGDMAATEAKRGRRGSCLPRDPGADVVIFASYHTHGAFDYDVPAEFPSVTDIEGDEEEGIDGYISTPGGRLWYVDTQDMTVSQICSLGCLAVDPSFEAGLDGEIAQSYTYNDLQQLEAGGG